MPSQPTLYDILEVSPYASLRVIRAAYRCLAQCSHPDKHDGAPEAMAQQSRFNAAYAVLSDPHKRQGYDKSIGLAARCLERRSALGVWPAPVGGVSSQVGAMRVFAFRPLS